MLNHSKYRVILILIIVIFTGCVTHSDHTYLDDAIKVSNWLETQKVESNNINTWTDLDTNKTVTLSLSKGVSGKVMFYLQLYNQTQEQKYLVEIENGSDFIIQNLETHIDSIQKIRNYAALYGNMSGSIFVLAEVHKLTNEQKYLDAVNEQLNLLDKLSDNEDGRYWNDFNDILNGNSGTGLLLLNLYENTKSQQALTMAIEVAETLIDRAKKSDRGLFWNINENENGMNLPNFSHGTAGVGFYFAKLFELTDEQKYLEIAKKAGHYLDEIALVSDSLYLLPYSYPIEDWSKDYDLGWAHGPAGAARFYYQMWKITKDDDWLKKVKKSAYSIVKSGFPNQKQNSFPVRNFTLDQRFGLAGILDFFIALERHSIYKDEKFIDDLIEEVYSYSIETENHLYWSVPGHRFMRNKGKMMTFTGYFYGTTGFGQNLINLHHLKNRSGKVIRLPDNPFD